MKKTIPAAFFLFFSVFIIFADEEAAETKPELFATTIITDIETSSFHELSDWCVRLDLPKDGSAVELRRRLYDYYNVKPGSADKDSEEAEVKRQITIEKAENLDYFTIEKVDENYARITGDVYLKLHDGDRNEDHIIRADTILFNFKENFLTATGNIRYQLEGETKTENFRGDKLTFNIDNAEGLFDQGVTEQERDIEEQEIIFYFRGELINKTKDNYVLLEDGQITSCDLDEPHFTIKAQKIWLLTSNEWAIQNGVIYIGRVPMMYIPAFLYGEDDIIFNPVFGYNSNFGNYLQTTTYFIGEKEKDDDSVFSFMQSDTENKYYKIEGLYKTADDNPSNKEKAIQDYGRDSKNYIKLLLDYYTYLGIYAAFDMDLNTPSEDEKEAFPEYINSLLSVFKNTELYLSAARTRLIDNSNGFNSALFPDTEGFYKSLWYNSFFIRQVIPVRYGIDLSSTMDLDWVTMDTEFALYSDPSYTKDFSERSETLDLLSFMDQDDNSTESGSETGKFNWSAALKITPDTSVVNPWIKQFSVNAETNLGWNHKDLEDTDELYQNTVDTFFYPDSLTQLAASLSLGGQIFPLQSNKKKEKENKKENVAGDTLELRPPWEEDLKEEEAVESDNNLPDAAPDISIDISDYWNDTNSFSQKLSYNLTPKYSNKSQLSTSDWKIPDDIDLEDIDYSYRTASVDSKISYSADIFGKLFSISDIVSAGLDYKEHYDMESLNEDTIQNYYDEDQQGTDAQVTNNLTVVSAPLVYIDYFENIKITYNFNSKLWEWDYSTDEANFKSSFFDYTEDYITAHKVSLALPFEFNRFSQTLTLSTSLPPVELVTSGSYVIKYGISTSSFSTDFSESEDELVFSPLTFTEKLDFAEGNNLTNNISYNYSELYFEKNVAEVNLSFWDGIVTAGANMTYDFQTSIIEALSAKLNLMFFSANFTAKNTYNYEFDPVSGWIQAEDETFIPESLSFGLAHKSDDIIFWKNRVNLNFDLDTDLNFKLIQFTDTNFIFKLGFELSIFKFIDLKFDVSSINNSIYRYIPYYCEQVGVNQINLFEDLMKSFNFFQEDNRDRKESSFNLQSINISMTHDLHDWDLTLKYSGSPYINKEGDKPFYDWKNSLDIALVWKAIPDIKSEIEIDNDGVSF